MRFSVGGKGGMAHINQNFMRNVAFHPLALRLQLQHGM
jgi:hypothetical protein